MILPSQLDECIKCNQKFEVVKVFPQEGYYEIILACGHKIYARTDTIVVKGSESKLKAKAETEDVTVFEGELPCLLVYSDPTHVTYINEVLSLAEDSIRKHGFKPQRLSGEIRSGQDHLVKISSLIESAALVVIILDGLRPNVTLELGMAIAKRRPFIIIRSRDSVVSVKTLYNDFDHSGLTKEEFKKLRDPILDPNKHLSDFAGKYVPVIDRYAKETEDNHPSVVFKRELTYQWPIILEELQKIRTKDINPNILNEVLPHLIKIISLSSTDIEFELEDLLASFEEINKVLQKHGQDIPEEVGNMVGSAFIRRANLQVDRLDRDSAILSFRAALNIFGKLLALPSLRTKFKLYGTVNDKTAFIHLQLYDLEGDNLERDKNHLMIAVDLLIKSERLSLMMPKIDLYIDR